MPGLGHVRPRFRPIAPPLIKASSHGVLRPNIGSKPTTWRVIASRFGTASPKMIRINRRVRRIETEPNGDPVSASTVQAVMNTLAADLMIVDPPADRVLQSHHEGQSDREGRRLPWKSRADPR